MINCSHCGTQNRDGSKFCGNCGARLTPVAGLICPMCGTANKLESVFCLSCGARLTPLTSATAAPAKPAPAAPPIKGLSLPARESPGELPAELQELEAASAQPTQPETPDWLDNLRAASPTEETLPATEEADVPDWLNSKHAPPAQTPTELELAAELPPWLEQLRPAAALPKADETKNISVEQVPDWLTTAKPAPASAAPQPQAALESPTPKDQTPDWLKTTAPAEPAPASAAPQPQAALEPPTPKDQTPDWLKTTAPAEPAPASAAPQPQAALEPPTPKDQTPDWLKTTAPAEPAPLSQEPAPIAADTPPAAEAAAAMPQASAPTPVAAEEIPAWLLQLKPQETPARAPAIAESAEPLLEALESQIPADLTAGPIPALPRVAPSAAYSAISDDDIPDWLRTASAAPASPVEPLQVAPAAQAAPTIQPALPEEVPDWLASLKPQEQPIEDQVVEASGPLAGLRGVLPLALAVAEPHPPQKPTPAVFNNDGGQLFEAILAAPQFQTTHPAETPPRRNWSMRPLIYLLMTLAVVIPFFIPANLASTAVDLSNPSATNFYDTVQAVSANKTVVLSFDYDPSQASEMDLQARAIVQQLIAQRVKIIALSTQVTGAPLAQKILDTAARGAPNYAYGVNYLNLGYRAGYEAGLSQLATAGFQATAKDYSQNQALTTFPAFANLKTLRDVDLVIVLAGTEDALKMWMEQVQPSGAVPIIAGVSASVEPKARAYRDTPNKQLAAVLSGLVGAAQYEVLSNQTGLALTQLNAQSAAQLALVLIILLGNLVYWLSDRRKQHV